jgi:hypothetical protein
MVKDKPEKSCSLKSFGNLMKSFCAGSGVYWIAKQLRAESEAIIQNYFMSIWQLIKIAIFSLSLRYLSSHPTVCRRQGRCLSDNTSPSGIVCRLGEKSYFSLVFLVV